MRWDLQEDKKPSVQVSFLDLLLYFPRTEGAASSPPRTWVQGEAWLLGVRSAAREG